MPSLPPEVTMPPAADRVLRPRTPSARRPAPARAGLFLLLALAWLVPSPPGVPDAHAEPLDTAAAPAEYQLEVYKSRNELLVRRAGEVTRRFRVALGIGGRGDKRLRGDNRTPVGTYRIVDFNESSRFELFMHLNYPNVKDAFYGLQDRLIDRVQFDSIVDALRAGRAPPQDTALGGAIGIHGIGADTEEKLRIHRSQDWTQGCIALTDQEIQELRRYVAVGTKVIINE